ncbi:hypothetical protein GW932_02480 [archaeon]|nr:hypothetical protein [archaeon]
MRGKRGVLLIFLLAFAIVAMFSNIQNVSAACATGSTDCCVNDADCSDNNACTNDYCGSLDNCYHSTISCNDGNLCTIDSCSSSSGCSNVPVTCYGDTVCSSSTGLCVCPTGTTKEYSCTGQYISSYTTVDNSYCYEDPNYGTCTGYPCSAVSFLSLLGDLGLPSVSAIEPITGTCAVYTTPFSCEGDAECNWYSSTYQVPVYTSCSGLSESTCATKTGCTVNIDCISTATQSLCQSCTDDTNCFSGNCNPNPITGSQCVNLASSCSLGTSSACEVLTGQTKCISTTQKSTCSNGLWTNTLTCPYGCNTSTNNCNAAPPAPVAYWSNNLNQNLTSLEYTIPFTINLKVKNYDATTGTFYIYEDDSSEGGTENTLGSIPVPKSAVIDSTSISFDLEINENTLALTSDDSSDSIYEFYFIYKTGTKTISPILTFTRQFGLCENSVADYADGEEGVDCGPPCGNSCCGNSACDIYEDYTTCSTDCDPTPEVMWSLGPTLSLSIDNVTEGYPVQLRLTHYAQIGTASSEFTITEQDTGLNQNDDEIKITTGTVSGEDLVYTWTMNLDDFTLAQDRTVLAEDEDVSDNSYEFEFGIEGLTSGTLTVQLDNALPTCGDGVCNGNEDTGSCTQDCFCNDTMVSCSNYISLETCRDDTCNLAENSGVPGEVSCTWSNVTSKCGANSNVVVDGKDIGSCFYDEDTTSDTCEDGFLSYSWDGVWTWAANNFYVGAPTGVNLEQYVEEPLGSDTYHFDPNKAYLECAPGQATIPCPAQIQLSFFTWKNLVAAAILVLIIYLIVLERKKSKQLKKKAISTKKVAKKKVVKKKISKKK